MALEQTPSTASTEASTCLESKIGDDLHDQRTTLMESTLSKNRQQIITMATTLEYLHKISTRSTIGLVKLGRLVKNLKRKRPKWPFWSKPENLYKDQELVKEKFLVTLMSQNVVQVLGKDTYLPGPAIESEPSSCRTFSDQEKRLMTEKSFHDQPFICLRCYRNSQSIDLTKHNMSLDDLLQMLAGSLTDLEPDKKCACDTDQRGQKVCGGKGNTGTCSEAQRVKKEQFRLVENWLKLKNAYSNAEWFRCPYKESGAAGKKSERDQDDNNRKRSFYVCSTCLKKSRAHGVLPSNGLCAKEVSLMIHNLLLKEEEAEGRVHCLCPKCSDNPDSKVSTCRRETHSQSLHGSTPCSKVDENVIIISEWCRKRSQRLSERRNRAKKSCREKDTGDEEAQPASLRQSNAILATSPPGLTKSVKEHDSRSSRRKTSNRSRRYRSRSKSRRSGRNPRSASPSNRDS